MNNVHSRVASRDLDHLLAPLVNLLQKGLEHLLLQAISLVDLVNLGLDVSDALLFPLLVKVLQLQLVVELLDLGLFLRVLVAVVFLEDPSLLGIDLFQSLVDQPRALVILNVSANLAEDLWVGKSIKVVVLRLEILAHWDENVVCGLEVLGAGSANVVQRQGNGEVEGVVGGLVDDNESELVEAEVVEVDVVLGGSQEVAQLAALGLEGDLVEELDHVDVALVLAKVLLEEHVDGGLEHEGVVDGNHADLGGEIPAGRASARLGRVHDVVGDEEEGLEQFDHPS